MSKKINLLILTIFAINLMIAGFALAQTGEEVLGGFGETGRQAGFDVRSNSDVPERGFAQAFSTYATGLAGILGGLFLILALYAGWLWMSARGNDDQVKKAKDILVGAVIGITIVIAARIIAEIALAALAGTIILK